MPNIALLLRSTLIKDGLSVLLTDAGFSVFREPNLPDDDTTVMIDLADCRDPEAIHAHQRRRAKIVVLASESAGLTVSDDQIAPLSGFLTYGFSADAFVQSLRLIDAGERVFPRELAPGQRRDPPPSEGQTRSEVRLSPREREVLLQVVEGHSNKVIARVLGMTEATAKVHLKSVLRKIRVDNRTQAAMWALSNLPELKPTRRGSD